MDVQDKIRDKMEIHLPGVIKTLGEAMYTDPWVALRELIQNATDSCTIRRAPLGDNKQPLDPQAPPAFVRIYYESLEGRLIVEDNGCGMTWDEVKKFLSVIGKSKTDEIRDELEKMGEQSWADRLIGRFGLGLLSAFIIGQAVTFETRSYKPDSRTVWWQCSGGQHYEMGYLDEAREPGTKVTVDVDKAHRSMFENEEKVIAMIKRYADLLPIPIYFGKTGYRQVNVIDAPWLRQGTLAEYRQYLQQRFPDDSILHVIPVEIEEPATEITPPLRVGGALFVPKQPEPLRALIREYGTVAVYVRRMFVTENEPELLPRWAKFVKGVIDSPDLRETTSRESVVHDANFARAKEALGKLILNDLRSLADNDSRLFRELVAQHNVVIKVMAIAEPELFDAIKDIVLFKVEDRLMSLARYFVETGQAGLPAGTKRTIYYSSNIYGIGQHAFLFAQKGWRVIDASSYPDEPFLLAYQDRYPEEIELVSLDAAGDRVFVQIEPKEDKWLSLEDAFLRNRIEASVVRFEPADIPAVLVEAKDGMVSDDQLEQILKAEEVGDDLKSLFRELKTVRDRRRRAMLSSGAVLYLNADSEIVQRLAERDLNDPDTIGVMIVLYNNALMLSARALTPETAKVIFDGNNRTIKQLMDKTDEVRRLREAGADPDTVRRLRTQIDALKSELATYEQTVKALTEKKMELTGQLEEVARRKDELEREVTRYREQDKTEPGTPYITCFVMMPFRGYDDVFEALQRILETAPYFWRVARADQETRQRKIDDNVKVWIDRSHCYIAEITEPNDNVMMELGYAYWKYRDRPLLLLQRDNALGRSIADLAGTIRVVYSWDSGNMEQNIKALAEKIRSQQEFARQKGSAHYLSIYSIPDYVSRDVARVICERYRTIEDYIQAVDHNLDSVLQSIPQLRRGTAQDVCSDLKRLANL